MININCIIFEILLTLLILKGADYFPSKWIGPELKKLREEVKNHAKNNIKKIKDPEYLKKLDEQEKELIPRVKTNMEETLVQTIQMKFRTEKLSWLTQKVARVELLIFIWLTLFLLHNANGMLDGVKILGTF